MIRHLVYIDDYAPTQDSMGRELAAVSQELTVVSVNDGTTSDEIVAEVLGLRPTFVVLDLFTAVDGHKHEKLYAQSAVQLYASGSGLLSEEILVGIREESSVPIVVVSDRPPGDGLASYFNNLGATWVLQKAPAVSVSALLGQLQRQVRYRRPITVLLIDDEPEQRQVIREALEEEGLEVLVAVSEDGRCDVESAWGAIETLDYDVLALDLLLDSDDEDARQTFIGLDAVEQDDEFFRNLEAAGRDIGDERRLGGLWLLWKLRNTERTSGVPVVVLSRFAGLSHPVKQYLQGVLEVLKVQNSDASAIRKGARELASFLRLAVDR